MAGKQYTLYSRRRKNGKPVYYVKFKKPDGTYQTAVSTGEGSRIKAEAWAHERLQAGNIHIRGGNITLAEYAGDFFNFNGPWATDKKSRGMSISLTTCQNMQQIFRSKILPVFGKVPLNQINRGMIKQYRNDLYLSGFSGSTINKTLTGLKQILESAEEQELISAVPRIDRAAEHPKTKGILSIEETKKLFSLQWPDIRGYAGNLLAASTGLRLGELQALQIGDIHFEDRYITINKSWDKRNRILTQTKTKKTRNIFFPVVVADALLELIKNNPWPIKLDRFIFYSDLLEAVPIDRCVILKQLYFMLNKIGISDGIRRERTVTFHSWRHWFNSLLINAKVPLQAVQNMTGHLTAEMTQHYYHNNTEGMNLIRDVQENIFPAIN